MVLVEYSIADTINVIIIQHVNAITRKIKSEFTSERLLFVIVLLTLKYKKKAHNEKIMVNANSIIDINIAVL